MLFLALVTGDDNRSVAVVNHATQASSATCNTSCVVMSTLCGAIILAVVIFAVLFAYRKVKARRRKMNNNRSEFVGDYPFSHNSSVDYTASTSAATTTTTTPLDNFALQQQCFIANIQVRVYLTSFYSYLRRTQAAFLILNDQAAGSLYY